MPANQINLLAVAFMTPPNPRDMYARWGLPMMLKGDPGSAKTALIKRVSERLGLNIHTTLTAIHDPTDFAGLMFFKEDEDNVTRTRYATPPLATTLQTELADGGVCFFDEINCGAPSTQAAALRIILEGVIGEETVSPKVRFIAACNDPEQAPNADELAMSLANRFGHLDWVGPSIDNWGAYMLGEDDTDLGLTCEVLSEADILANWGESFKQAATHVVDFLRSFPQLRNAPPEAHDENASGAWPSNRTWDYTARALASGRIHKLNDEDLFSFLSAFVGRDATSQFTAWLADQDMPKPEDVLSNVDSFDVDLSRLDRTMALLASCSEFVVNGSEEVQEEYGRACWALLERVMDSAPDLARNPATALASAGIMKRCKPARNVLAKLGSAMTAAGYGG